MVAIPPFTSGQLEQLAHELAEAATGSELDRVLREARIPLNDISTKWRRLREAFETVQRRDASANAVARFISILMDPARFASEPERYEYLSERINIVLGLTGLKLRDDGQLLRVAP